MGPGPSPLSRRLRHQPHYDMHSRKESTGAVGSSKKKKKKREGEFTVGTNPQVIIFMAHEKAARLVFHGWFMGSSPARKDRNLPIPLGKAKMKYECNTFMDILVSFCTKSCPISVQLDTYVGMYRRKLAITPLYQLISVLWTMVPKKSAISRRAN